jgi:hypothetical protein
MSHENVFAELRETEFRKGNGIVGLWIDWREYEADPRLFMPFLSAESRESRELIVDSINRRCGTNGIAAVVHRPQNGNGVRQEDSAMWLQEELRARWEQPAFAPFRTTLQEAPESAGVVLILARERYRGDGASVLYWGDGPGRRRIGLLDSEGVLPADLGRLVTEEHSLQKQLGVLQCYLLRRWRGHGAQTEGRAKQSVEQLMSEFRTKANTSLLRRFAGLSQRGEELTADELRQCCEKLVADLSRETTPEPIRLEARAGALLNWIACMGGESPIRLARRFGDIFGEPVLGRVPEQGLASTLLSNLEPSDRVAIGNDQKLMAAVQIILGVRAAYRWSNIFAHRDQYSRLMLSTSTMASVIRHEVAYLKRLAEMWRV